MVKFLFWNIGGNDIAGEVASATRENEVDILILAESKLNDIELLRLLNYSNDIVYRQPLIDLSPKLKFYMRFAQQSFDSLLDQGGIALRLIKPPIGREVLLVAVHLPSKKHRKEADQIIIATELGRIIRKKETELGHRNTIIIGDLNMDPFEAGIIAARGVHAVSDKTIARKIERQVDGAEFCFFYNPMWNFLGDENANPPGTYYYGSGEVCHFWHTFDQVMLRPDLPDTFSNSNLRILTNVNGQSLIRKGVINKKISDHLPILVKLDLERI